LRSLGVCEFRARIFCILYTAEGFRMVELGYACADELWVVEF